MCSPSRDARLRWSRWLVVLVAAITAGCDREARRFDDDPPPDPPAYLGNATAISAGKRYFEWYNCAGCHAHGGGSIGPALMDDHWIYGGDARSIYATIMEGRPNGMPSFRDKLNDQQAWQLVAFVRTLAGHAPFDVPPSRDDHLFSSWSPIAR